MNHEGSEVKIKDIPPVFIHLSLKELLKVLIMELRGSHLDTLVNMLSKACSIQYKLYLVHFTVPLYKCNQGFIFLRSLVVYLVFFVFHNSEAVSVHHSVCLTLVA